MDTRYPFTPNRPARGRGPFVRSVLGLLLCLGFSSGLWAEDRFIELTGGVRFRIPVEAEVIEEESGELVRGDLILETPIGDLPVGEAELRFYFTEDGSGYDRIVGTAQVPPPLSGDYVSIPSPAVAQVGYDYGEEIDLGVPLQPKQKYLYFAFNAGLTVEFGASGGARDTKPFALNIPGGASATMILDPLDPFFYFNGALDIPSIGGDSKKDSTDGENGTDPDSSAASGETASGEKSESETNGEGTPEEEAEEEEEGGAGFGMGRSLHGRIPFRPWSTYGIENDVTGFDGHHLYTGVIPIFKLPLELDGHVVVRLDPADVNRGLDPLGFGFGPSFAVGGNGILSVSFGDLLSFGFELGQATVAVEVFRDRQAAYFSGALEPDLSWIPDWVPLVARSTLKVAGFVSDQGTDARLQAEGSYSLDASGFATLTGLEIDNLLTIEGETRFDVDGVLLAGTTSSDLGSLGFAGEVGVRAYFARDPEQSEIVLTGTFVVAETAVAGSVILRPTALGFAGSVDSDAGLFRTEGSISAESGTAVLRGAVTMDLAFQGMIRDELSAIGDTVEEELAQAQAELTDATEDLEFELSLRGLRGAIPAACNRAIRELNKVPGKVSKRWPKKWGIRLPGRSSAVRHAKRQIAPHVNRLKALRDRCHQGTDEQFRSALRSSLRQIQKNRHVKVRVKRVGTVYRRDLLSGGLDRKISAAIAAIDSIPSTSTRKMRAAKIVRQIEFDSIAAEVAAGIETGAERWTPTIERIEFEGEGWAGTGGLRVTLVYQLNGEQKTETLTTPSLFELPGAVARQIVRMP